MQSPVPSYKPPLCPSHDTFTLVPRLFGKAEWTAKIPCGLGPYGDSRTVSCTARSPVIVSKIWPLAETTWAKPLPPTPLASTAGFSDRLRIRSPLVTSVR